MMEKRFFSHYNRIDNGGNGGVVSFRCPNSLVFIIDEIIIRENTELALAGGANVNINYVSSAYKVTKKITSQLLTHILPTNYIVNSNGSKSFVASQKKDSEIIPMTITGGDIVEVEIDTIGVDSAIVDIIIVGQLVGEW